MTNPQKKVLSRLLAQHKQGKPEAFDKIAAFIDGCCLAAEEEAVRKSANDVIRWKFKDSVGYKSPPFNIPPPQPKRPWWRLW